MADTELDQAIQLSEFTFRMELARRRAEPTDDDFDLAVVASANAYEEELHIRRLLSQPDDFDVAVEISRITYEAEQKRPKSDQNNCLDVAFKKLYRIRFGHEFAGNVRDEIRQIANSRFGKINANLYEVDDGQQLSVDAFESMLNKYGMRVLYRRKNGNGKLLGSGRLIHGYAILHTVGADYGATGEYRYAGHYEVVDLESL